MDVEENQEKNHTDAEQSVHPPDVAAPIAPVAGGGNVDDIALMQGVSRQDPAALRDLYNRYAGFTYSLCYRILRNREAAEDVLLEVFWEVWHKCDRYDASRGSASTYLATLARSRALDRLRAEHAGKRQDTATATDAAARTASAQDPVSGMLPPINASTAPLQDAMLAERRDQVKAALARLTPDQRAAMELAYFEGLSHAEVAQRMEKPLGTVKSWIRQGLIHLRDLLRNT